MPGLPPDLRMEMAQTPAEREREQSLLDDPYARVLGPSSVQCRQCLKKIKLSSKSAYDTFHWRNHRARCLRAMKKKMKASGVNAKRVAHSPSLPVTAGASGRKPGRRAKRPKTPTPPLVTDSEDDRRSEPSSKVQSPAVPTSPLQRSPPVRAYTVDDADPRLEEYMLRSHPECVQALPAADHGRNWSWAQLKQRPHFAAPVYYDDGDDGDEDEAKSVAYSFDRSVVDADEREQEAARTLTTLFRSR